MRTKKPKTLKLNKHRNKNRRKNYENSTTNCKHDFTKKEIPYTGYKQPRQFLLTCCKCDLKIQTSIDNLNLYIGI